MRALLMVSALLLGPGCVAGEVGDDGSEAASAPGLDDPAWADAFALESRPDAVAACTASIDRFVLDDGSCVARATVRFECGAATQVHDWARVGVLCGDEICAYDDVTYRCGAELARSFAIPCGAVELIGGATFDHPVTSADVSCLSQSLLL